MSKGSILFISKRRDAASTRYRIFQYWHYLQDRGWSLAYHPATESRIGLVKKSAQADIVVIQRRLFDPITLALLHAVNGNIVFDYDDAIFLNDDGSPSSRRQQRFSKTTERAKLCLAGNSYLASHSQGRQTVVFPTTVELAKYQNLPRRTASPVLTLVWVGSRSTSRYLEQYRTTLETLGREIADVELKVIGDFTIDFAGLSTRCVPWTAEGEIAELANADIGIAPMTDDPWTRGKCALKVIQYMACGLPVISSNCGANAEVIVDGQTGILVSTPEQWLEAVKTLGNGALRERMGKAGLERAKTHYSAETLAEKMDGLFTEMLAAQD
ncbi:MAG: glycosyltransferase family 4 protein [Cellvibrionaceae bacterium]